MLRKGQKLDNSEFENNYSMVHMQFPVYCISKLPCISPEWGMCIGKVLKCLSTNLGSKLKPVINRYCIFNSVKHL